MCPVTLIVHPKRSVSTQDVLDSLSDEEKALYRQIPDEVDFIYNARFAAAGAEEEYFGSKALAVEVPQWTQFPEVPEEIVPSASRRTTLGAKDEVRLFLQYNFARYTLNKLIQAQRKHASIPRARQMVTWYKRTTAARANLVRANMALVLAMVKRTRIPNVEFGELVSEGNMALLRSVDKFDVARGFKFSTYGCRAILKSFNRLATKTGRYRQHFPTEFDPEMERSDYDVRKHEIQKENSVDALREILARNRARLSGVERKIVLERFAITTRGKGRTLAEVGKMVGLTNERVRQIQNLALDKIRGVLDEDYLAA